MLIQKKIYALIILLILRSAHSETSMPTPKSYLTIDLTETQPLILVVRNTDVQEGLVNSAFRFNLKPLITSVLPDITYRITHVPGPSSKDITSVSMVSMGLSGIPEGFVQTSINAGDCATPFTLAPYASCLLHFYVDQNKFISLQDGNGPVISTHISWLWGSRKNRDGGKNIVTSVTDLQSIINVFTPILKPSSLIVLPISQDGLYYDEGSGSIIGVPTRIGLYKFNIIATNGLINSEPGALNIMINVHPKRTPLFKSNYLLASARSQTKYFLNLNDLIELMPEDITANTQLTFRMIKSYRNESWVHIDEDTGRTLQGMPRDADAGKNHEITLIATSNTGGDSRPITVAIPVIEQVKNQPTMMTNGITLHADAGTYLQIDLRKYITSSIYDENLQIIIDSIKPQASFLSISRDNPTLLEGIIPANTAGQCYEISLHANTTTGGNSSPVIISLQVNKL